MFPTTWSFVLLALVCSECRHAQLQLTVFTDFNQVFPLLPIEVMQMHCVIKSFNLTNTRDYSQHL